MKGTYSILKKKTLNILCKKNPTLLSMYFYKCWIFWRCFFYISYAFLRLKIFFSAPREEERLNPKHRKNVDALWSETDPYFNYNLLVTTGYSTGFKFSSIFSYFCFRSIWTNLKYQICSWVKNIKIEYCLC